jgi:O-antigen/teichoic acid export membrane protein
MKRKLIHDISVNSFQVIVNQLCGLGIFYVLSVSLTKNIFGELNWSLAILLTAFSILSFGIDQASIKKIASGNDAGQVLSTYISHVLIVGFFFYTLLLVSWFFVPGFFHQHHLLLFLGIGKLMLFFSTPFKQLANGLEKFRVLFYMSVCSNIIRSIALIIFAFAGFLNLRTIIIIFIIGDTVELILSLIITKYIIKTPLIIRWNKKNYLSLIKESMPLMGVAVFTSAIARFDWIFLGLLASNIILAEYSFAYKVFEVSTLPLLAIAPILIPRFTKLFHSSVKQDVNKSKELFVLLRIEIIAASSVGLILNILWIPVIDFITHGKYGAVNHYTILLLSICTPFLYFNNFLWTILFAQGRFKLIFNIIFITCLVNIIGDIFLILFFKAEGAALAYLLAMLVQFILYFFKIEIEGIQRTWQLLIFIPACAIISGILATFFFHNNLFILFMSLLFFATLLLLSNQFRVKDWQIFKQVAGF